MIIKDRVRKYCRILRKKECGKTFKKMRIVFYYKSNTTITGKLTFNPLSKKSDMDNLKWWTENSKLLKLDLVYGYVKRNMQSRSIKVSDFELRRYIFLQVLTGALPAIKKGNLLKQLKTTYKGTCKLNTLEYSISVKKNILTLLDTNIYRECVVRIMKGISSLTEGEAANTKKLSNMTKKLKAFSAYEDVLKFSDDTLKQLDEEDLLKKEALKAEESFVLSIKDFNMPWDERRKLYDNMVSKCSPYLSYMSKQYKKSFENHIGYSSSLRSAMGKEDLSKVFEAVYNLDKRHSKLNNSFLFGCLLNSFKYMETLNSKIDSLTDECSSLREEVTTLKDKLSTNYVTKEEFESMRKENQELRNLLKSRK